MNQLTRRLLAVAMALALLGALAVSAEPVGLDGPDLTGAQVAGDLPEIGDLALDPGGIDVADVTPVSDEPAAQADDDPAPNGIVNSGTCGEDVRWTLDSDGLLTISGIGNMDGETYFFYFPGIKRVVVEAGVTSIGANAFNGCAELVSVSLPDTLQNIWAGAFMACRRLPSIEIPYGIPFIPGYAFAKCYSLTEITLPESVTEIVDHAFDGCPRLTIRGYDGSYAQTYARENGMRFVSLGAAPRRPSKTSLVGCEIAVEDQAYNGRAKKPAVQVTLDGRTLNKGADYFVAYADNTDIGTATVTVTGMGDYTGAAQATFTIRPRAVTGLRLTAGKGRLTARWKQTSGGVTGYQLEYSRKSSFKGSKKANVKKEATVQKVLKKLKSGKTWYVRVRAYKKVDGKVLYSVWSGAKKVKVK